MTLIVILFTLLATIECAYNKHSLNGVWHLTNKAGNVSVPATVPGVAHLALIENKVIGDPYYRMNEIAYNWIPRQTWVWTHTFATTPELIGAKHALLQFESIDTVATVSLNGQTIEPMGQVKTINNMFIRHEFSVRNILKPSGNNTLVVTILPVLEYNRKMNASYPYEVPFGVSGSWADPTYRNFVRKTSSDYGWDWGPGFIPGGIPGDVSIIGIDVGHLGTELTVDQAHLPDGSVLVNVSGLVRAFNPSSGAEGTLTLKVDGVQSEVGQTLPLNNGPNPFKMSVKIPRPKLWWPNGYGAQELYKVRVQYSDPQAFNQQPQELNIRIGLRTVELVEVDLPPNEVGKTGKSFFFRINGLDIFAKGANWIPTDAFLPRVSEDFLRWQLESAVKANMNMVRVWGGGYYQPDLFYQMADELGLMVWQEMMFACSLYPRDSTYLNLVSHEIRHTISNLQHHASIVIWGGNNENEGAILWYQPSRDNVNLYTVDYNVLYVETVRVALREIDADRPFVDSSPSNGLMSVDPYVKRWGNVQAWEYGDVHYYNYEADCEDYTTYPMARFVSEHGFQSFPSFEVYQAVTEAVDWNRDSEFNQFRMRHPKGNQEALAQIARHFHVPPANASSPGEQQQVWDNYLFLTQVQQARCYETAFTNWRRLKSQSANTMGILYWQLNDIWQGPSWSSLEYTGKWKVVHNTVKRVYEPVITSAYLNKSDSSVRVYMTSDKTASFKSKVTISLLAWDGDDVPVHKWEVDPQMASMDSKEIFTASLSSLLASPCTAATCFLRISSTLSLDTNPAPWSFVSSELEEDSISTPDSYLFFTTFAKTTLPASKAEVISVTQATSTSAVVKFTVSATAPFVWLESGPDLVGHFSDNGFVAVKGESYTVTFNCRGAFLADALKQSLRIRSLTDTYQ